MFRIIGNCLPGVSIHFIYYLCWCVIYSFEDRISDALFHEFVVNSSSNKHTCLFRVKCSCILGKACSKLVVDCFCRQAEKNQVSRQVFARKRPSIRQGHLVCFLLFFRAATIFNDTILWFEVWFWVSLVQP